MLLPLLKTIIALCSLFTTKGAQNELESVFLSGNEQLRSGNVRSAIDSYLEAIAIDQDHHFVWTNLGHAYLQVDEVDSALSAFTNANQLYNSTKTNYNLAVAHQLLYNYHDAVRYYLRAVEFDAQSSKSLFNLGVMYQEQGNLTLAIDYYHKVLAILNSTEQAEARLNLCNIKMIDEPFGVAKQCFEDLLRLQPYYSKAIVNLASLFWSNQYDNEALRLFQQALVLEPDNVMAQHGLTSLQPSTDTSKEMNSKYVADLFDSYSFHFESSLASLQYQSHHLVVDELFRLNSHRFLALQTINTEITNTQPLHILDLGAGTGLTCPLIRQSIHNYASHLSVEQEAALLNITAVDLSLKMLLKARGKQCYNDLIVDDIVVFLQQQQGSGFQWDLIIAADVFMYLGDLFQALTGVKINLAEHGFAVFTVEDYHKNRQDESNNREEANVENDGSSVMQEDGDYQLQRSGRFGHSKAYIERVIAEVGLKAASIEESIPRYDKGRPVHGLLIAVTKILNR